VAAPPDRPVLGTPAWRSTTLEFGQALTAGQRLPGAVSRASSETTSILRPPGFRTWTATPPPRRQMS